MTYESQYLLKLSAFDIFRKVVFCVVLYSEVNLQSFVMIKCKIFCSNSYAPNVLWDTDLHKSVVFLLDPFCMYAIYAMFCFVFSVKIFFFFFVSKNSFP